MYTAGYGIYWYVSKKGEENKTPMFANGRKRGCGVFIFYLIFDGEENRSNVMRLRRKGTSRNTRKEAVNVASRKQ